VGAHHDLRTQNRRAMSESLSNDSFACHLEPALHVAHHIRDMLRSGFDHGSILIGRTGSRGSIYGDCTDENVTVDPSLQLANGCAHVDRRVAVHVDAGVPLSSLKLRQARQTYRRADAQPRPEDRLVSCRD
jgi:hypothetical protein